MRTIDASVTGAPFLALRRDAAGSVLVRGTAACQLGRHLDFGREIPDGIFAEWRWDGAQLVARNDRYGLQPFFYARTDDGILVSPSLPRLLLEGAPPAYDDTALAVFLRTGYFVGEDTPFQAIRALPPNAALSWSAADGLCIDGGLPLPEPRALTRDEAIDAYIPRFREAVRKRLPANDAAAPEFVMPLSGGRDSRHILLELVRLGCRPTFCLTVRHHLPRVDQDAQFAAQLAAALHLPQVVLDQTEPRLLAEQRKNLKTGFCSDEGTAFLALGDYLETYRAGRPITIWDGIAGDFLSDGRFLSERRLALLEAGDLTALADDLLHRPGHLPDLLRDDVAGPLSREVAIARLRAELERHLDAPNPIQSYIFQNRCRREIATFPTTFYSPEIVQQTPYLDHDLVDFLLSLPARVFLPPSFHADTIHRAYPEYAQIPFETPTVRRDARYHQELRELFDAIDGWLERQPSRLLDAAKVRARMAEHFASGRTPALFTAHTIYALQLEEFVASLPPRA